MHGQTHIKMVWTVWRREKYLAFAVGEKSLNIYCNGKY